MSAVYPRLHRRRDFAVLIYQAARSFQNRDEDRVSGDQWVRTIRVCPSQGTSHQALQGAVAIIVVSLSESVVEGRIRTAAANRSVDEARANPEAARQTRSPGEYVGHIAHALGWEAPDDPVQIERVTAADVGVQEVDLPRSAIARPATCGLVPGNSHTLTVNPRGKRIHGSTLALRLDSASDD